MSHTHFLYHFVFATKDRMPLIAPSWEMELYKYLGGVIRNLGGHPIEINGMPDHVHIFTRLPPLPPVPEVMQKVKASSSKWAKQYEPKFSWQRRYGGFTVSESASESIREYISKQKEHHLNKTFEHEYKRILELHHVEFDERYLWD